MPTGLELLAQHYAKPKRPKRAADMFPDDRDDDDPVAAAAPVEPDLNNPSTLESVLKTVGLGGYAVRNTLMGNFEGAARNVGDALTSIPRAIMPGDQSYLELSRKEDAPEFSDVIGGMEPGWGKLGVDIAGGILTDPLSFLGVGQFSAAAKAAKAANAGVKAARASGVGLLEAAEAAKAAKAAHAAARAAGESKTALGFGVPFMAPAIEMPGSAAALGYIGDKIGQGAGYAAKGIAKIPGGSDMLQGAGKMASSVRGVFGAQKPNEQVAGALAAGEGIEGSTSLAARNSFIEINKGYSPDVQRKAWMLLNDITEGDGVLRKDFPHVANEGFAPGTEALSPVMGPAIAPTKFKPMGVSPGLSDFGTEMDQAALIDRRLAMETWDDATKAQAREAALANSGNYRRLYSQSLGDQVMERPGAIWTKGDRPFPNDHVAGLHAEDMARTDANIRSVERGIEKSSKQAARQEAKLSDANEFKGMMQPQLEELKAKPGLEEWAKSQGYSRGPLADNLAPLDYTPRQFDMKAVDEATHEQRGASLAKMLKPRSIEDSKQLADMLNSGATVETNLAKIGADYGSQLAQATRQAKIATSMGVKDFKTLVDPDSRKAVNDVVESLRQAGDHDSANMLSAGFNGLAPPTKFWKFLASANKPFKAAATAGIVIPRLNFTIGNTVSNVIQTLQNPEARAIAGSQLKALPGIIAGSIGDGLKTLGVKGIPESEYDQLIAAARSSDGTRANLLGKITDPTMRKAVENGVLDGGFVSSEQLAANALTKGDPKKLSNWLYWTQDIARASEQRMRYSAFKALLKNGETAEDAARIVNETLFDYKFSSVGNRNARQIFPFGQYTFKAVPQAAKFLGEKPAALAGLNAAYSQNDANEQPLPVWTQGKLNIPLGEGASGNKQYLSSLRMPVEQLANIPNPSGDLSDILSQTRTDVGGMLSPLIKTGIAAAGGTDPRTNKPFMSDDRAPNALQALGVPERSKFGRLYNGLAATGAIQRLVTPVQTISSWMDERKSPGIRGLSAITGLNVIDVDEQQAMKQLIEDAIRRDPSIQSTQNYYQLSETPEGQALIDKINKVRSDIRKKKKDAAVK